MHMRFALRRHLVALLFACSILPFLAACGTGEVAAPASTPTRASPPTAVTRFLSPPSPTETPIPVGPTTRVTQSPMPSLKEIPAAGDWVSYPSLNDVRGLAFAPDGSLWAGTGSGVVRWDLATDTHIRYSTDDGLASDDVTGLAFAPDGTLWVATRGGVSHFDGTSWTSYTEADGLISNIAYAIAVAADGSAWVGTQNGVSHFDGVVWSSYTMANGLAGNVVWYVAVAPDGDIWFSTHTGGVSRYNPGQNTWTTYGVEDGLPLPNARFLTIGPNGAPWLHIGCDHVYRFDGTTWQATYEAGGGQWVCDMAFDANGLPWVATCGGYHAYGAGLAHFDGTTWSYTSTTDGLVDDDVSAVAVAPDGTTAAGTDRGISVYQAGRWRTADWPHPEPGDDRRCHTRRRGLVRLWRCCLSSRWWRSKPVR